MYPTRPFCITERRNETSSAEDAFALYISLRILQLK